MQKPISTDQTPENIQQILHLLAETPVQLEKLSQGLSEAQLHQPIAPGERSLHEILTHLINCESRTFDAITLALLLKEPSITPLHPERDFGKLYQFERQPFPALLAYFNLRRAVLLPVLTTLTPNQWGRVILQKGKKRQESVYWQVRGLALHEQEHILDLKTKRNK
ncbi:MAG: hypothetical protein Fur0022_19750 [Anaerolineales bacterium]